MSVLSFCRRWSRVLSPCRQNGFLEFSTDLRPSVRLSEVPDVCFSREWEAAVRESRSYLQQLLTPNSRDGDCCPSRAFLPAESVVKRLRNSAHRSNYLIETFKQLLTNSESNTPELRWPGLVTLLLSTAVGSPFDSDNFVSKALEDHVRSSQLRLAETLNLVYVSFLFQKESRRLASSKRRGQTNVPPIPIDNEVNRLVTCYLTSLIIRKASLLKNAKVLLSLSNVVESLSVTGAERVASSSTLQNLSTWEYSTFQPLGLLLAAGCQSALELAGHDDTTQELAMQFGESFAMAIKANTDIEQFLNYQTSHSSVLNMSSLPVCLHLERHPETMLLVYNSDGQNLNINQINYALIKDRAVDDAKEQLSIYISRSVHILHKFTFLKNTDVLQLLVKLLKTLENNKSY